MSLQIWLRVAEKKTDSKKRGLWSLNVVIEINVLECSVPTRIKTYPPKKKHLRLQALAAD
jgi:hypothetical protein